MQQVNEFGLSMTDVVKSLSRQTFLQNVEDKLESSLIVKTKKKK